MSDLFRKIQDAVKNSPEVQELRNDVVLQLKAEAYRKAADELSGYNETRLVQREGAIYVELTDRQKKAITNKIYKGLTSNEPGPIRAPYIDVILPAAIRAYGKQVALTGVALFFLGRLSK